MCEGEREHDDTPCSCAGCDEVGSEKMVYREMPFAFCWNHYLAFTTSVKRDTPICAVIDCYKVSDSNFVMGEYWIHVCEDHLKGGVAMSKCFDCEKEISEDDTRCPTCQEKAEIRGARAKEFLYSKDPHATDRVIDW